MRYARGEHADGGELFRLKSAQLTVAFLGDVAHVDQGSAAGRGIRAHVKLPFLPGKGAVARRVLLNRLARELGERVAEVAATCPVERIPKGHRLRRHRRLIEQTTPGCVLDQHHAVGVEQKQPVLKNIEGLAKSVAFDAELSRQLFQLACPLDDLLRQFVVVASHLVGERLRPQGGTNAGHDLDRVDRLHDEIRGTAVETALAVFGLAVRSGEKDDRQVVRAHIRLDAATHLEAVQIRQIGLHQRQVAGSSTKLTQSLDATADDKNVVRAPRTQRLHHRRLLLAVLCDKQNASHWSRDPLRRRRRGSVRRIRENAAR